MPFIITGKTKDGQRIVRCLTGQRFMTDEQIEVEAGRCSTRLTGFHRWPIAWAKIYKTASSRNFRRERQTAKSPGHF